MLKKIAIAVAVAAVVGGGVFYYYVRQATALPEWYEAELALESDTEPGDDAPPPLGWEPLDPDDSDDSDDSEDADDAAAPGGERQTDSEHPPGQAPRRKTRARKSKGGGPRVMRGFHRRRKTAGKKTAVKASRATLDKGKLEAGVVLDLSRVPQENLMPADKKLYDRAVRGFPGITKRDVYVGIEDRPVSKDGVLQLGPNPKVRVGNLRYSLASAASKLGMTEAQLRRDFNNELRRLGFTDPDAQ